MTDLAETDTGPTTEMLIAGLERGLAWMKEHGVNALSPWQDYPRPVDTLRVVYTAMREAERKRPVVPVKYEILPDLPKDIYRRDKDGWTYIAECVSEADARNILKILNRKE